VSHQPSRNRIATEFNRQFATPAGGHVYLQSARMPDRSRIDVMATCPGLIEGKAQKSEAIAGAATSSPLKSGLTAHQNLGDRALSSFRFRRA
jgi:hypothetical protein